MRDKNLYTKEELKGMIKHTRMVRDILMDEESRLILLYQIARDKKHPVDARGVTWETTRRKYKVPETLPRYLKQSIQSGETMTLPGWQD